MPTIIIKTQADLDALPDSFTEFTVIEIRSPADTFIYVRKARESSHVVARESSHVVARGSSHVVARESSHVVARESSHVEARESSHVEARGSSHVEARESSHVEAWGSSHVEAWGSSHVVARESSHVEAWGSSHVVARESSHVEAWGSSHVEAWGSVAVHNHSESTTLEIFAFAVVFLLAKVKVKVSSKTATVIIPKRKSGVAAWLEGQAVKPTRGSVVLFKRVSKDFETTNNIKWIVGTTVELKDCDLKAGECGEKKLHFCSRAYFCDEFRSTPGDKYIAVECAVKDLYAWPNPQYPHKISGNKAKVLYICDRYGKLI